MGLFIGEIKFSQRHTGPPEAYHWLGRTLRRDGIRISESQDIKPLVRETQERLRAERLGFPGRDRDLRNPNFFFQRK